jgi:hypothetical protein
MDRERSKYPEYPEKWWERGVIPRDIEAIYSGLMARCNTHPNLVALSDVAAIVRRAIDLTFNGDPGCGAILGELLAFLWKKRSELAEANFYFEERFLKLQSARPETKKRSALRRLIQTIIAEAASSRLFLLFCDRVSSPSTKSLHDLSPILSGIDSKELRALPEFGPSEASVSAWTEVIVYPILLRMELTLRDDPEIGSLKKAKDENGKFHVSCLKSLIRQTVRRIASVPRAQYFDISNPPQRSRLYE